MISIYSRVCQIHTPCHSFHLCYPCISVNLPSLLKDVLGGRNRARWEIQLGAAMEQLWRCTSRLWSSGFGDALGGFDQANLEMHLEAIIEQAQRHTWRLWSSEFGDALGGGDWARLEEYWEAVNLEAVVWKGGATGALDSIHSSTRNCGNVVNWVQTWCAERWDTGWKRKTVDVGVMQYAVYAVLSVCCTWCMLYLVYAVLGVYCTRCQLLIMAWRNRERWLNFVFLGDGRIEDVKERYEMRWGKSSWETGT